MTGFFQPFEKYSKIATGLGRQRADSVHVRDSPNKTAATIFAMFNWSIAIVAARALYALIENLCLSNHRDFP